MFNSEILDTAIGLMFVFLLVSVIVTIVNEAISAALMSRAKWLRFGIERLIGSHWAQHLFAHPLVGGIALSNQASDRSLVASKAGAPDPGSDQASTRPSVGSGPSYISSRAFCDVIVHLVQEADHVIPRIKQAMIDEIAKGGAADALRVNAIAAVKAIAVGPHAAIAIDLEHFLTSQAEAHVTQWFVDAQARAAAIADPDVRAALVAAMDAARKRVAGQTIESVVGAALDDAKNAPQAVVDELNAMLARLRNGYTVANAMADIKGFATSMPSNYIKASIDSFPDGKLKRSLQALLNDANHDLEHFKQNVETWFNNGMDRVSGWYKRRAQWVVLGLSVAAAVGLNVDAIQVVHSMQSSPEVRKAVVDKAIGYAGPPAPEASDADVEKFKDDLRRVQDSLSGLGLPIGWSREPQVGTWYAIVGNAVASHWFGWLLTALAASLGAPFWFDMLNRIMSIRSAGKAPEEKPRAPKTVSQPLEPGQSPKEAAAAAKK